VTVIATVIANNIGLVKSFATLIPQGFVLQSLLLWAALVVIAVYACHSMVAFARKKWFVRNMGNRLLRFLETWNELGKAYGENDQTKISDLTARLIVLYPPIRSYVTSQVRVDVTPPFSDTQIRNYDMIGNFLMGGVTGYGYTLQEAYDHGRRILLTALGSLGYHIE
jgi:hypothetical protein